ncbi:hypothetical protein ACVDFE_15880 [Lentzea chajnantorensis]
MTALFSISEPYDDVVPVTTHVTFWAHRREAEDFVGSDQQLMLLSTEPTTCRTTRRWRWSTPVGATRAGAVRCSAAE